MLDRHVNYKILIFFNISYKKIIFYCWTDMLITKVSDFSSHRTIFFPRSSRTKFVPLSKTVFLGTMLASRKILKKKKTQQKNHFLLLDGHLNYKSVPFFPSSHKFFFRLREQNFFLFPKPCSLARYWRRGRFWRKKKREKMSG